MSSLLRHECWLPLFGLPLVVRTNSAALSAVLDDELPLGNWVNLSPDLIDVIPSLQVDVLAGDTEESVGGLHLYRHGPISLAGDGKHLLMALSERGYGLACVPAQPLSDGVAAIWELGKLLARGRGRVALPAAALVSAGRAVLLIGANLGALIEMCKRRGLCLLAHRVVHISMGGRPQIWGDGSGGDLLHCAGPVTVCLVERGVGRASQILPLLATDVASLADVTSIIRAAYRLQVGGDMETAAALIEHVV